MGFDNTIRFISIGKQTFVVTLLSLQRYEGREGTVFCSCGCWIPSLLLAWFGAVVGLGRGDAEVFSFMKLILQPSAAFYALATKHLGIGMSVCLSVGLSVCLSVCFDTTFKKVETMSCKVYTVQSVYTGQGPGTVHVYTQLWAEHRARILA